MEQTPFPHSNPKTKTTQTVAGENQKIHQTQYGQSNVKLWYAS
jgi:hypothetical protein